MSISKKAVILGDSGVGKTSLLVRYLFNQFDENSMPTLGASFKTHTVPIPGSDVGIKLNLWDTAG